ELPFLRQLNLFVDHLIEGLAPGGRDVQVVEIRHFFSVSHCAVIALHDNVIVANRTRGPQEPPPPFPLVEIGGGDYTFASPYPQWRPVQSNPCSDNFRETSVRGWSATRSILRKRPTACSSFPRRA